ncbi:MAG TPA: hypothetical protein VFG81_21025 [Anaerolineales bacterium]|nr:hypothetical protein [Anaerolineales bacterium]
MNKDKDLAPRNQGSGTPQSPKSFVVGLQVLASLIRWLTGLSKLTEEEREDAGVYLDRLRGE